MSGQDILQKFKAVKFKNPCKHTSKADSNLQHAGVLISNARQGIGLKLRKFEHNGYHYFCLKRLKTDHSVPHKATEEDNDNLFIGSVFHTTIYQMSNAEERYAKLFQ